MEVLVLQRPLLASSAVLYLEDQYDSTIDYHGSNTSSGSYNLQDDHCIGSHPEPRMLHHDSSHRIGDQ